MKKLPINKDRVWATLITLVVVILFFSQFDFIESLEYKTFDLRTQLRKNQNPGTEIVIVDIDNESISKLGQWPWPRSLLAQIITTLDAAGARIIGLNILFSEPEENNGLPEIRKLKESFISLALKREEDGEFGGRISAELENNPVVANSRIRVQDKQLIRELVVKLSDSHQESLNAKADEFMNLLNESEDLLDNDSKLYQSLQNSNNVILPMFFQIGSPMGENQKEDFDKFLQTSSLMNVVIPTDPFLSAIIPAMSVTCPIARFAEVAKGIGHINVLSDADGAIRWEILVIQFRRNYLPSFALQVAIKYFNVSEQNIKVVLGEGLDFGSFKIPTDREMRMLISYNGPNKTFPHYSFYDVVASEGKSLGL